MIEMYCPICHQRMAGSPLVDLSDIGAMVGIYLIHIIDAHWNLVERIRATKDDGAARQVLNSWLEEQQQR